MPVNENKKNNIHEAKLAIFKIESNLSIN